MSNTIVLELLPLYISHTDIQRDRNMELRKYSHLLTQLHSSTDFLVPFSKDHFQQNSTESSSQQTSGIFKLTPFTMLVICFGVALIIIIIIVICYRKYRTRQMYQQSPQNFTSRPQLSFKQNWKLQQQIKSFTPPNYHSIIRKQTYDGKYIEVVFKSNNNCIYFPNQLTKDCYFEIEIVKLCSVIQIGFVHTDKLFDICKKVQEQYQFNLDNVGVSVRTDGTTSIFGNNKLTFPWSIEYGDTLGIGITQHPGSRRVWITKNGIIQNQCSQDEKIKYLDINKEKSKNKTTVTNQKKHRSHLNQQFLKRMEDNQNASKWKIEIQNTEKFKYYAVIISENPILPLRETIINWNVGGQNYRLYDATKLATLLK